MNSKEIVKAYGATLKGQQLLFPDDDIILRNTPFIESGDKSFDREALVHWWLNVYVPDGHGDDDTPYEVFKSWSDGISHNFKYINSFGHNPETQQRAISLWTYKKDSVEAHLEDLNMWLPHIIPSTDENGRGERKAKHIEIMEHTCSRYGRYSMSIYSDREVTVNCLSYGRHRVLKRFDCIEDAVEFVKDNHCYKK